MLQASSDGTLREEYLNRQIDGTLSGGEMKKSDATVLAKEHTHVSSMTGS
ncbi:MAG: hypothetical protein ACLT5A_13380 [Clostridiaceae bacterium]